MSSVAEVTSPELRWRNYQQLVWSQQQIHLQIQQQQQQQQQQQELQGMKVDGSSGSVDGSHLCHAPHQSQASGEAMDKSVEEKTKEIGDPWENFDAQAAFLGPTLWEKRLPYDGQDFKLEYVDLEEFLTENGIPVDENGKSIVNHAGAHSGLTNISHNFPSGQFMAGPSRSANHSGHLQTMSHSHMKDLTLDYSSLSRSPSPSTSSSSNESRDLTPAVSPDSTQPNTELSLVSVPGHEFDPRRRVFTDDELKPQPMIKKSRKQFVPDNAKDAKYWVRRRKNNMAAKRSRDARRVKENQIAMRACYLEKENQFMKQELERVQKENTLLKEQINSFAAEHQR